MNFTKKLKIIGFYVLHKFNLNHIMNFGEDSFEAKILNTGEVVHDMLDFIKIARQYV